MRLGSIVFHVEPVVQFGTFTFTSLFTATDGVDGLTQPSSLGDAQLVILHSDPPTPPITPTPTMPTATPPTATPTAATPTPPTPAPTTPPMPTATPPTSTPACADLWPVTAIVTIGKGQSPSNNPKVSHTITGNIIDPDSLGATAHRIPVCAGSFVDAVVTDTSGGATNTARGSLTCATVGCSGIVDVTEKYKSVSADGSDTDRMTFVPQ